AEEMTPAGDGYAKLRADLAAGKKLLYLTDNAGEIGFDYPSSGFLPSVVSATLFCKTENRHLTKNCGIAFAI
ncbi:MAG: hypothetical protein IIX38_05280, partial [Alistipes sp.]|nr:hypothetical protein [Alistipes sp.]